MTTYDGGLGTTVTVNPVDSSVSIGFDSSIVLLGTSTGTATINEPVALTSQADADDKFGADSEVAAAFTAAQLNGASTIFGVAVDDASSNPYSDAAMAAMGIGPRYVVPVTDQSAEVSATLAAVNDYAGDLIFARVIAPGNNVEASDVSTYSPTSEDQRLVEVAPSTATVAGKSTFTAAAVAGQAARQPLGSSITYDQLNGIESLGVEYRRSVAQEFEQVTAVTGEGQVVEGVTTSAEDAFADIFQVEIVDAVTEAVDAIGQDYAGSRPNTLDERKALEGDVTATLAPLARQRPPLLSAADGGSAFAVNAASGGGGNVDLTVSVSPVDIMKQIDIELNVGDVVTFEGVTA